MKIISYVDEYQALSLNSSETTRKRTNKGITLIFAHFKTLQLYSALKKLVSHFRNY